MKTLTSVIVAIVRRTEEDSGGGMAGPYSFEPSESAGSPSATGESNGSGDSDTETESDRLSDLSW